MYWLILRCIESRVLSQTIQYDTICHIGDLQASSFTIFQLTIAEKKRQHTKLPKTLLPYVWKSKGEVARGS